MMSCAEARRDVQEGSNKMFCALPSGRNLPPRMQQAKTACLPVAKGVRESVESVAASEKFDALAARRWLLIACPN